MQGSLYARRVRSSLAAGVVYGTHRIARYLFHLCPLTLSTLSTFSAQWRPSVVPSPRLVPISIEASSRADSERSSHSLALPSLGLIYLQLWLLTHPRFGEYDMSILAVSRSSCVPWLTARLSSRTDSFMTRTITRTSRASHHFFVYVYLGNGSIHIKSSTGSIIKRPGERVPSR